MGKEKSLASAGSLRMLISSLITLKSHYTIWLLAFFDDLTIVMAINRSLAALLESVILVGLEFRLNNVESTY